MVLGIVPVDCSPFSTNLNELRSQHRPLICHKTVIHSRFYLMDMAFSKEGRLGCLEYFKHSEFVEIYDLQTQSQAMHLKCSLQSFDVRVLTELRKIYDSLVRGSLAQCRVAISCIISLQIESCVSNIFSIILHLRKLKDFATCNFTAERTYHKLHHETVGRRLR